MNEALTVLVVEDEKPIADILRFNLELAGYRVLLAADGGEGLRMALAERPDLILLDIMLPVMDGFSVCKALRKEDPTTPVLLLTAREDEEDKVLGLELGADDYITKPFSIRELLARCKANIRRTARMPDAADTGDVWTVRDLTLDQGRMEIRREGKALDLSQRDYDLMLYLWKNKSRAVSREELMEKVWGYEYYGDLRAVDVAVRRLREKLEKNPAEPEYILTKRGAGYLFNE